MAETNEKPMTTCKASSCERCWADVGDFSFGSSPCIECDWPETGMNKHAAWAEGSITGTHWESICADPAPEEESRPTFWQRLFGARGT